MLSFRRLRQWRHKWCMSLCLPQVGQVTTWRRFCERRLCVCRRRFLLCEVRRLGTAISSPSHSAAAHVDAGAAAAVDVGAAAGATSCSAQGRDGDGDDCADDGNEERSGDSGAGVAAAAAGLRDRTRERRREPRRSAIAEGRRRENDERREREREQKEMGRGKGKNALSPCLSERCLRLLKLSLRETNTATEGVRVGEGTHTREKREREQDSARTHVERARACALARRCLAEIVTQHVRAALGPTEREKGGRRAREDEGREKRIRERERERWGGCEGKVPWFVTAHSLWRIKADAVEEACLCFLRLKERGERGEGERETEERQEEKAHRHYRLVLALSLFPILSFYRTASLASSSLSRCRASFSCCCFRVSTGHHPLESVCSLPPSVCRFSPLSSPPPFSSTRSLRLPPDLLAGAPWRLVCVSSAAMLALRSSAPRRYVSLSFSLSLFSLLPSLSLLFCACSHLHFGV